MIKPFSERQRWSECIKNHKPTIRCIQEVDVIFRRTEKMHFICKGTDRLKATGWKKYTVQTVGWIGYINVR